MYLYFLGEEKGFKKGEEVGVRGRGTRDDNEETGKKEKETRIYGDVARPVMNHLGSNQYLRLYIYKYIQYICIYIHFYI